MVKFLLVIFFMFLVLNKMDYKLIQMIYQNFMFILCMLFFLSFPFNNLNYWMKIYYFLGYDLYSYGLILLSLWILSLMIMSSLNLMCMNYIYYINLINFLTLFLLMCFSSMNLIMFYLFFESSLIPVFMLILGWGFQVYRIQAGFYMMLYTLVGSMPLLFLILVLYSMNYTLMFNLISMNYMSGYYYISMILAFLIKMPMYLVHLWLPKAHVEAPLTGSMILAGVMLKLGSYGLIRFMNMMIELCMKFNKFIIVISLMGGIYSSLICLCQIDMKMLVAYSSVVHMSLLMGGLLTMLNWGYMGGMLMMIAHGLCSSGMFFLVNLNYERLGSRSLFINKGMINYFPSLSLMWFFLCSCNMSFPPSLNLFGEMMLLNSLILWMKLLMLILMVILFFSAAYTLYLYSYSQHGKYSSLNYFMKSIMVNEFILVLLHWIPLNLAIFYMNIYI